MNGGIKANANVDADLVMKGVFSPSLPILILAGILVSDGENHHRVD